MKTSIICVAVFMLFMALGPAHAQRCPAGADAFLNCLPLDHRYGGPGTIQQRQSRPRMNRCVYNYVMERRSDPRIMRLVAETIKRGNTVEAANSLRGTRDYVLGQRQAFRACRGTI
jgi:hypothetical protein